MRVPIQIHVSLCISLRSRNFFTHRAVVATSAQCFGIDTRIHFEQLREDCVSAFNERFPWNTEWRKLTPIVNSTRHGCSIHPTSQGSPHIINSRVPLSNNATAWNARPARDGTAFLQRNTRWSYQSHAPPPRLHPLPIHDSTCSTHARYTLAPFMANGDSNEDQVVRASRANRWAEITVPKVVEWGYSLRWRTMH